jgi:hypothetical protein
MGVRNHTRIKSPKIIGRSLYESQKACTKRESKVLTVDTRIQVGVKGLENAGGNSHESHEAHVN